MAEQVKPLTQSKPVSPAVSHGFGSYVRKVLAIVGKDIAAELRTKEMMSTMFIFSLLIIFIFNFAFDLRAENMQTLAPGVLWVAVAFAGMLGLSRSFILERDQNVLDGLLLAPVDRSAIYFGKMIGNVLFIGVVEVIILPFTEQHIIAGHAIDEVIARFTVEFVTGAQVIAGIEQIVITAARRVVEQLRCPHDDVCCRTVVVVGEVQQLVATHSVRAD